MNDEWSLKGKRYFIVNDDSKGIFLVSEKHMKKEDKYITLVYKDDDIETLYKKLIEDDIKKFQDGVLARITSHIIFPLKSDPETMKLIKELSLIINQDINYFKQIIIRRFGFIKEVEK